MFMLPGGSQKQQQQQQPVNVLAAGGNLVVCAYYYWELLRLHMCEQHKFGLLCTLATATGLVLPGW
jgi:hypothetical protein